MSVRVFCLLLVVDVGGLAAKRSVIPRCVRVVSVPGAGSVYVVDERLPGSR